MDEKLKQYLKNNLKIEMRNDYECDTKTIVANLILEDEVISSSYAYIE